MQDRYAVFGHPVGHSLSPRIHAAFAAQTGQSLSYEAIDPDPEPFEVVARRFCQEGGLGFNVTVPYKGAAWELVDQLDAAAERAGAVNTVRHDAAQGLLGFNTDGAGLVCDLRQNLGAALTGRRILIIGAGGAAAGILGPLLDADPKQLVVANRTVGRARALIERFAAARNTDWCGLDRIDGHFDLLINATAAQVGGSNLDLPGGIVADDALAYDLMYAARPTPFMRWAESAGARRVSDGKGMLVEQAAEAFLLWRGIRPDTSTVISELSLL